MENLTYNKNGFATIDLEELGGDIVLENCLFNGNNNGEIVFWSEEYKKFSSRLDIRSTKLSSWLAEFFDRFSIEKLGFDINPRLKDCTQIYINYPRKYVNGEAENGAVCFKEIMHDGKGKADIGQEYYSPDTLKEMLKVDNPYDITVVPSAWARKVNGNSQVGVTFTVIEIALIKTKNVSLKKKPFTTASRQQSEFVAYSK